MPTANPSIARWTARLIGPLAIIAWMAALIWVHHLVERDTLEVARERAVALESGVPEAPQPIAPGGLDNRTLAGQMRAFHHLPDTTPQAPHSSPSRNTHPAQEPDTRPTP